MADLTCPDCGLTRNYRPAEIAKRKSPTCWDCRSAKKRAARVTLKCPHCGHERSLKPSEAAKRSGESCFHCARYVPAEMPDTYDADYVVGVVSGYGFLISDKKPDGRCGYYVGLTVTDRAFAEKFRHHAAAAMNRRPWMKPYVTSRDGTPEIGMPPTTVTDWHVKAGSRQWHDMLVPYKKDRNFDGILDKSEEFRRGFLQGVLDSDGYVSPHGYCDISKQDIALLEAVKAVLESLGERAAIYGPYPYSRGVAHLRTTAKLQKTTEAMAVQG